MSTELKEDILALFKKLLEEKELGQNQLAYIDVLKTELELDK